MMFLRVSRQWLVISCLSALIAACGGGGGGGSGTSAPTGSSSAPTSPPTTSTTPTTTPTTTPASTPTGYSVHISWTAPTTRADGSPLLASDLAGYELYYTREGTSASQDQPMSIHGGTTTSVDLPLQATGTYTFAITAVDNNGSQSALSTPVSITIN